MDNTSIPVSGGKWVDCGFENQVAQLEDGTKLRYGARDKWLYKTFHGTTLTITYNYFGGDPLPGVRKVAQKWVEDVSINVETTIPSIIPVVVDTPVVAEPVVAPVVPAAPVVPVVPEPVVPVVPEPVVPVVPEPVVPEPVVPVVPEPVVPVAPEPVVPVVPEPVVPVVPEPVVPVVARVVPVVAPAVPVVLSRATVFPSRAEVKTNATSRFLAQTHPVMLGASVAARNEAARAAAAALVASFKKR